MRSAQVRLLVLALVLGAGVLLVAPGVAQAGGTFSGRIVDLRTGAPIAGVTVQLSDTAGHLLDGLTATSTADGSFTVAGATAEEYGVHVDGAAVDYSPGWLGSGSVARGRFVVDTFPEAVTWAPRDLGDLALFPAFFTGRFVDPATGAPLAGVTVQAREDHTSALVAASLTTSGADGRFLVRPTPVSRATPTYHVVVTGAAVGRENGEVGVLPAHPLGRPVGPHGSAVSLGPGDLGDIVLDPAPTAPPASADTWGFNYLSHTSVPPGTDLTGALMRQVSHDTPEAAGDRSTLVPIRVADQMCNNVTYLKTLSLLDSSGRVVVASPPVTGPAPRAPMTVPAGTAPGRYYLRIQCAYGTEVGDFGVAPPRGAGLDLTDPAYRMPAGVNSVSVCTRVDVTAAGSTPGPAFDIGPPHGATLTASSPALRRDPCPTSLATIVGRGLGIPLHLLVARFTPRIVLTLPPVEEPTTTTTTTRPPALPPAPPPPPAADTTPPQLSGVQFTTACPGKGIQASFQVTATDDVGVTSVTYSWTYTAPQDSKSGSGSMSGSNPYSGTAVVNSTSAPGTLSVNVTARDAAGNTSSASNSIPCSG